MIDPTQTGRQLISASSRQRTEPEHEDEVPKVEPRRTPGKSTGVRIDRRAELDDDVDDGALASAFDSIKAADSGQALPGELAQRLQRELGVDLSRVRLHTDDHAAAAAAAISARAFTIGEDIYFARGAYDPDSELGVQLIAHEVAHVAQNQRGTSDSSRKVSRPDDHHERSADEFARGFGARKPDQFESDDPAALVDHVRAAGRRMKLPFAAELEEHFGQPLDFVEAYTGEAAELACRLMAAGAFAVRNVVALADPSPQRETLMHELTHVMQMGGRSMMAPAKFEPGSLRVGGVGTAAEHEADEHAARPGVSADANTIHRDTGGTNNANPKPGDKKPADATRVAKFKAGLPQGTPDKAKLKWAKVDGERATARYYAASVVAFTSDAYEKSKDTDGGTKADLDAALAANGVIDGDYRLHRNGSKYVISKVVGDNYKYEANVVTVSVEDRWVNYDKACQTITSKGKAITFEWDNKSGGKLKHDEPATSEAEFKSYREAMRTKIAEAYAAASPDGMFGDFYKEVVQGIPTSQFPVKTKGSIFEALVAEAAKTGVGGIDPAESGKEIPVWDLSQAKSKPVLQGMKKKRLDGDGVMTLDIGETVISITEAKAYANGGGPTTSDKKKMGQYKELIVGKIPGYVAKGGGTPTPVTFNHVAYNIAVPPPTGKDKDGKPTFDAKTKADLELWMKGLGENIGPMAKPTGKNTKYSAEMWSLHPPPTGEFEFKVKFNPELVFEVPAETKSINLSNPPVKVPGLKVSAIKAQVDDSHKLTSGSITYGVEAGDIKKPQETKTITASADAGTSGGTVDNKLTGLTSKLKDFLPVDIDAAIIDDGVEATIKLKPGQQIPNLGGFTLSGDTTEIKATYRGGGALEVNAQLGIKHNTKDIKGSITIDYDGGWAFEGKVTIGDGVIPGVSALEAKVSKSASGEWKIGANVFTIEKQIGAIKLTGTGSGLEYNVKSGMFKGDLELNADLGMFGTATGSASIENNKLTKGTLSYDSPELKYPKDKPAITGTVGGTVKLNDGKFSGDIRGTANLSIPALQKIAKDGVGLAVDAHIGEDGNYTGSIKSTKPLEFGKHLRIPSVGLTFEKGGELKGDFEIEIINIKNLTSAKAKGTVDKSGVHIQSAEATVEFGNKDGGKFWGSITAKFSDDKGFDVSGTANYKIKDDITATGTIKYSQETNAISVELKVTEITLFDKKMSKQLFKASKQIPVVNVYGLGIYIDIGFDLGFDFGFKLTMAPSAKVEDFSLDTMEYKRIAAKLEVGGDIYAQLTGTPKLGVGVFALDPSILRGGGGLKVPIVGRLDIKPKATFEVGHTPGGGVDGSAKLGLAGEFGIKGSVKPYAEFSLLNDLWNPKWEGDAIAEFEILKPKELFNFTVDLNSDKKQEDPELPGQNDAKSPSEPVGDQTAKATPAAATERGGEGGGKSTPAKQGEVAESGDEGPFSLNALMSKLKAIPGFATAEKIFGYAKKIWKVIEPIVDIVKPIFQKIIDKIETIISLFDESPTGANLFPWLWKLAKALFGLATGGLTDFASAIIDLVGAAVEFGKKLISKGVEDGHIGVKRHEYYIWRPWPWDDYEFLAAAEYKVNIPGIISLGPSGPPGFLLSPSGAVSLVLYEALTGIGIGYTYTGKSGVHGQPFNDIWRGGGARG